MTAWYRLLRALGTIVQLGCSSVLLAQEDYTWWNTTHDWNGVTPWPDYMKFTAGYMGPNALPVPEVAQGYIDSLARFEVGPRSHWSTGDDTQDLYLRYLHPFAGGRVAVGLDWMAYEHYRMDTVTRDERASRDRDGEGFSTGDVNVNTLIQLVPEQKDKWGLSLRIKLRTASGNNLKAARHTDAPGYSFDLSTGRWFTLGTGALRRIRPYAMAGFLAYQTNRSDYYQNDCFLYGAGVILDQGACTLTLEAAGYTGYLQQKDSPLLVRASLGSQRKKLVDHRISFQKGIHDWAYTSIGYTLSITWPSAR